MHGYSLASVPTTNIALKAKFHFTGDTDGKPLSQEPLMLKPTCLNGETALMLMCVCVGGECVCGEKSIKPQN